MGINREKEKVRDGYLIDLPEDLQKQIMSISKMIIDKVNEKLDEEHYEDLKSSRWAMSCLDDFTVTPTAKGDVGSIRVFKVGKQYKCMIHVTGHFKNHQYGWIEELLHEIIKDAHQEIKPEIRKKFDVTLVDEGDQGNPEEGFAVALSNKLSKTIWDKLDDRKTRTVVESGILMNEDGEFEFDERFTPDCSDDLIEYYECFADKMSYDQYFYEVASRRELKFDYRRCTDANTGHHLQIVYSLDNIKITALGGYSRDMTTTDPKQLKLVEDNIKKTGDVDHESKGQRVLAIRDTVTGKSLNEADTLPLFRDMGNRKVHLKVGQIDNVPSFKSTFWDKKYNDPTQSDATTALFKRQQYDKKQVGQSIISRGVKLRGIIPNQSTWKHYTINEVENELKTFRRLGGSAFFDKYINDHKDTIDAVKSKLDKIKNNPAIGDGIFDASDLQRFITQSQYALYTDTVFKKFIDTHEYPYKRDDVVKLTNELNQHRKSRNDPKYSSITTMESASNTPAYNVDMTEVQAKKSLRALSQDIIDKTKSDKNYKVSQYTANIYANIITNNLLPKWSSGYKKLSITLDSYQSFFTFEFKVPTITPDFISRFIEGREPMNAFLHRIPEIKIKMSPRIFHTMQNPDDAYNFFKAAVKYYDSKVDKYSKSLMSEVMKMNHSMKHLISTTKLSGLVTYPMQLLFVFDDVHMNSAKTFELTDSDIKTINQFMKNIYTRYAAPEKEKKKILEDVKEMVKELREACEIDDNIRELSYLPEAVETYLNGGYDDEIKKSQDRFEYEQVDQYDMANPVSSELKYIREKFGVKKLKRIPNDLVAYITIEAESIESPNDKMMIASYCLSKIEIVEWYIELLEVGSKKYVVPHSKPYLEGIRTQLLACYKKIMDTKVTPIRNRPIIDIRYPAGYEG